MVRKPSFPYNDMYVLLLPALGGVGNSIKIADRQEFFYDY